MTRLIIIDGGGAPTDPYFDDVILLTHYDDNATDYSPIANALTVHGGSYDATTAKFTKSIKFLGSNTNGIELDNTAVFNFTSAGDFTVEGWVWFDAAPTGPQTLLSIQNYADSFNELRIGVDSLGWFVLGPSATTLNFTLASSVTLTTGAWQYYRVDRQADTYTFRLNGSNITTTDVAYRPGSGNKNLKIANINANDVNTNTDIYLDDTRITKLFRPDTSVPTEPFPNS